MILRQRSKKGVGMQFNWLFIIIAGAVFIGFFFSILSNRNKDAESERGLEITNDVKELLRISDASSDTEKLIPFNTEMRFLCSDGISEYFVGRSSVSARYDYQAVFSPARLDGKSLVIKTSAFEAPFSVMPFIYLSNTDVEYVFVNGSASDYHLALTLQKAYDAMPINLTKTTTTDTGSYPDNNYDMTVFIFDKDTTPIFPRSFSDDRRVSAIAVDALHADASGRIYFFKADKRAFIEVGSAPFFGPKLLLGAAISYNYTLYGCQLEKATRRLSMLSELHLMRMEAYSSLPAVPALDKEKYYAPLVPLLEEIQSITNKSALEDEDYQLLSSDINQLKVANARILRESEHVPLY